MGTLIEFMDKVVDNIDQGHKSAAVLMDLGKAFDCVDLEILGLKLEHYGIRNKPLKLLKSYLSDRVSIADYNLLESNCVTVNRGVSQGSILGCLLFIICINDIRSNINCGTILFTDDTTLVCEAKDESHLSDQINRRLSEASRCLNINRLTVNQSKTKIIKFELKARAPEAVKLLGLNIDSALN